MASISTIRFDNQSNIQMMRPGSAFTKAKLKPSVTSSDGGPRPVHQMPTLAEYIKQRDWVGAIAFLENERSLNPSEDNSLWLAYSCFHLGDYRKAIYIY
jgi:intraflagellar transport protein 56